MVGTRSRAIRGSMSGRHFSLLPCEIARGSADVCLFYLNWTCHPGARPISVNLSRASAGECILSRRDSMIVARYEAWVAIQKDPRPGGTAEVMVSPMVSPRDICRRN